MSSLLGNIQRLGAKEDILTGIIATMLSKNPEICRNFYVSILSKTPDKDRERYFDFPVSMNIAVDAGVHLTKSKIKDSWFWPESFKPDIWIYDKEAEDWSDSERPSKSFNFIIECKEGARLSAGQIEGYPFLKNLFKPDLTLTLLIHCNASKDDRKKFAVSLNWLEISEILEQCLKNLKSKNFEIEFLFKLFHEQMMPDIFSTDKNDREGRHIELCRWVGRRIGSHGTYFPKKSTYQLNGKSYVGKWLELAHRKKKELWLYVEFENGKYFFSTEIWGASLLSSSVESIDGESKNAQEWSNILTTLLKHRSKFELENLK
ncbi:MAG: hypothetical protein EOP04_05080 [Proteobacteria bacterium]|nr:MAG: hypothetical protein EOP04_05080 [Pseudomonadota bacterium]